jgi:formylglycine-generating enzyme required for sulfatase activity
MTRRSIPFIDNPRDGLQLILAPAGEAIFGSEEDDPDSPWDGKPQFRAYLPDYYLGKYPVRNREYARLLDEMRPGDAELNKWILLDSDCHVVRTGANYRVPNEWDKNRC